MSSSALRKTMIVVAVIGLGWATYLTYVHYSGANPVCSLKGDPCAAVQKSRYSELLGVPVALIGAIGYLLILGSLLLADDERTRFATTVLTLGRLRLQHLPHLPRGLHAAQNLRGLRRQRGDHDDPHVPLHMALPARGRSVVVPCRRRCAFG